jgi:hypothetical protein
MIGLKTAAVKVLRYWPRRGGGLSMILKVWGKQKSPFFELANKPFYESRYISARPACLCSSNKEMSPLLKQ